MRRITGTALAAGSALLLAGCASGTAARSTWGQYFEVLQQSFAVSFGDGGSVTRETAAGVPYASMGYRLNGSPQALVVLATDTRGELLWTSSAHVVLVTENGRIKRTVGLPHDLSHLAPARGANMPGPQAGLRGAATIILTADFPDIGSYSAPITCRLAPAGPDPVTILGQSIAATRIEEDCDSPLLKWRFRNSYWMDADGFVWRSIQHLHPRGDAVEFEIFRPPG